MSNDSPVTSPLYPYSETSRPIYPTQGELPSFRNRLRPHLVLFVLTLLTTTFAGAGHYAGFISDFGRQPITFSVSLLLNGLWYSGTILAILTAHEMGHYLYCRRYGLDASLPYFLPLPLFLTGTLGAVIRIREPFRTRTQLFDIGIAGPIAGFLVLLPALFYGMSLSTVVPAPTEGDLMYLGEPLLFQWVAHLVIGPIADGAALNIHPVVFACWFGMFATALNLLPFGQFDGGHIMYAVFGDRVSRQVSALVVMVSASLVVLSLAWLLPAALMAAMWRMMGLGHPPPVNEYEPLSPGRRALAVIALIVFAVCFTPEPLSLDELVKTP